MKCYNEIPVALWKSVSENIWYFSNILHDQQSILTVLLDQIKAFYLIDYEFLSKLERYGIRVVPVHWCKSYLFDKHHVVEINSQRISTLPIKEESPSPRIYVWLLLFLISINDLDSWIKIGKISMFADVTSFFNNEENEWMNEYLDTTLWTHSRFFVQKELWSQLRPKLLSWISVISDPLELTSMK